MMWKNGGRYDKKEKEETREGERRKLEKKRERQIEGRRNLLKQRMRKSEIICDNKARNKDEVQTRNEGEKI